ncbi:DUF2254 domain-containing protein [Spirosoma luteolum]
MLLPARIRQFWQVLLDSLWFIPGLLIFSAMGLGLLLVELEVYYPWQGEQDYPLIFGAGADGSRGMLSAIAGSMLTVAGLTFTLTLSAISQVSSQYSPRLLRNYMSDRVNQVVMGYFMGAFAYCLIVLRTIRGSDEIRFVPSIAVVVGLLLALGGVMALIFFIHHIAQSMQVGTIVHDLTQDTLKTIDRLFPAKLGEPVPHRARQQQQIDDWLREPAGWTFVRINASGYLQHIDTDRLLKLATEHQLLVRLDYNIGDFVGQNVPMLAFRSSHESSPDRADRESLTDALQGCVAIGRYRTIKQDVGFGIQQLVDIILRALSPSTNDTTTAIMALDYLGVVMGELTRRPFPEPWRSDGEQLRVITRSASFETLARQAFDLVRINSQGNHALYMRLLDVLASAANQTQDTGRRAELLSQLSAVRQAAAQTLASPYEQELVEQRYRAVRGDA